MATSVSNANGEQYRIARDSLKNHPLKGDLYAKIIETIINVFMNDAVKKWQQMDAGTAGTGGTVRARNSITQISTLQDAVRAAKRAEPSANTLLLSGRQSL